MKLRIEFISHSGVTVETENNFFIFDVHKGEISKSEKSTTAFISHFHEDHYDKGIFEKLSGYKNVQYVVSKDVAKRAKGRELNVINMGEEISVKDFKVYAYDSTDEGVSFTVEESDFSVFFSGDLNLWIWEEDTEEEKKAMRTRFETAVKHVAERKIDLAFFPVDTRLDKDALKGVEYFIETVKPKYFVPIHYWDDFTGRDAILEHIDTGDAIVLKPEKLNDVFEINIS